jgi:hypothetical protein
MADPSGEADRGALRLDFDRRLMLQFRGSAITSDAGLLAYRELDDVLGLTDTGADTLADARTGKNSRHLLVGLLRQSVFGRLAGYEDVNDVERLCHDPAMRWVVGDQAISGSAASASRWAASRRSGGWAGPRTSPSVSSRFTSRSFGRPRPHQAFCRISVISAAVPCATARPTYERGGDANANDGGDGDQDEE